MTDEQPSSPQQQPSDDWLGKLISGKFQVIRLLGRGGMGCVYEAKNLKLGRPVALKRILPAHATNTDIISRFETEARAAGGLNHENILAVIDFEKAEDGTPYLVMELLVGKSLAALLKRVPFLDSRSATDLVVQACRGLRQAHAAGIVHRDLKPANLYLCQRADGGDLVKILDFGIAKLKTGRQDSENETRPGSLLGTPKYMSPEQARGDTEIDARADVYALGVILYEALSNKVPHPGANDQQILFHIQTAAPIPLSRYRPDLPKELCAVVERALASDPDERISSAEALEKALLAATRRPDAIASTESPTRATQATQATQDPADVPPAAPGSGSSLNPVGSETNAPVQVSKSYRSPRLGLIAGLAFLGTLGMAGFWRFTARSPVNAGAAAGAEVASTVTSEKTEHQPEAASLHEGVQADVHDGQRQTPTKELNGSVGSVAAPSAEVLKAPAPRVTALNTPMTRAQRRPQSQKAVESSTRTSAEQQQRPNSDARQTETKPSRPRDPWGDDVP